MIPGVHIETALPAPCYSRKQIDLAAMIADALHRGRFVLVEPPDPSRLSARWPLS